MKVIDSISQEARSWMHAQANAFRTRRADCTCPVYDLDHRGELDLVGSALLLKVGDHHFVVSAKHVFEILAHRSLGIGGEGIAELANQQWFFTRGTTSDTDRWDLAFASLSTKQVADLGRSDFLQIEDLALSERPDLERPNGSKYFAFGFPCTKQKKPRRGEPTEPRSLVLWALPAPQKTYTRLAVEPGSHLLLEFDRKKVTDLEGPRTSPKLNGMSGCGIWTAPRHMRDASRDRLVAVLIEYHAEDMKAVVGTRIGAVLDGIRKHFPALRPALSDI